MIPTRALIPRASRALVPAALLCMCAAPAFAGGVPKGAQSFPRIELGDFVPAPVQITCPVPSADKVLLTPPALQVSWGGHHPRAPFEFRYILLGPSSEFTVEQAVQDPEAFRDYYAHHPLGPWTGWSSADAHTTEARYTELIPTVEYLFAVIALDRAGNYSPTFDLSTNMLHFVAGYPKDTDPWAPVLTMSGPGLHYTYPEGGFCPCESAEIRTHVRANQHSVFRWSAEPGFVCQSLRIRWYRWALDIEDVFDESERIDEKTDLRHWSVKSADGMSATLGPFAPGEVHRLYVEVSDDVGILSLGIVRIEVQPAQERPLEIALAAEAPRGGLARLSYTMPEPGNVTIGVYDVAGRRVATLENAHRPAGTHVVTWDASGLCQGMYFYRLRAGPKTVARPVLVLR